MKLELQRNGLHVRTKEKESNIFKAFLEGLLKVYSKVISPNKNMHSLVAMKSGGEGKTAGICIWLMSEFDEYENSRYLTWIIKYFTWIKSLNHYSKKGVGERQES